MEITHTGIPIFFNFDNPSPSLRQQATDSSPVSEVYTKLSVKTPSKSKARNFITEILTQTTQTQINYPESDNEINKTLS